MGEHGLIHRTGNADPLATLHRAVDRIFEDFSKGIELPLLKGWAVPLPWRSHNGDGLYVPDIDVAEDEKTVTISAELPGMSEKDVEVSWANGMLTIKGEKSAEAEKEEKKKNFYHMERSFGSFQRSLSLPCEVDESKIDATLKKGVLTITLPKSEEARKQSHRIQIKGE